MALKLNVERLDDVDENLRSLYAEKDGKFVLAVDGIDDITNDAVSAATRRANKEAIEERKKRQTWEKLGKTPDEIAELLEAQEARAQTEAERKGEWDKLRAQMNDKHAKDLQSKDETIGAMRRRLEAELVDAKATAAIADAGGKPKVLLNVVKQFTKVDENFNVQIVDAKGDPRVNGKGEPLTIDDLVAEIKADEDYGANFKGSGNSGSGTRPSNGTGGTGGRITTKADLYKSVGATTPLQQRKARADYADAHGHEALFALPG